MCSPLLTRTHTYSGIFSALPVSVAVADMAHKTADEYETLPHTRRFPIPFGCKKTHTKKMNCLERFPFIPFMCVWDTDEVNEQEQLERGRDNGRHSILSFGY